MTREPFAPLFQEQREFAAVAPGQKPGHARLRRQYQVKNVHVAVLRQQRTQMSKQPFNIVSVNVMQETVEEDAIEGLSRRGGERRDVGYLETLAVALGGVGNICGVDVQAEVTRVQKMPCVGPRPATDIEHAPKRL